MIYSRHRRYYCDGRDGEWHCPFPKEWVERMKHAAKVCESLTAEQVAAALCRIDNGYYYEVPPGDFLSEPQDSRGMPLSWCREEQRRLSRYPIGCTATYDYDSIPEMVITDGYDDWPMKRRGQIITA